VPSALTLWPKPQIPVCVTTSLLRVNFSVISHSSSAPSGLQIAVLIVAMPLPEPNAPIAEILQRGFEMLANTAQFDCTHHPAMSVPCGMVDGLPVGMMLVAKAFDEETIYRAAAAFERGVDWKSIAAR